MHQKRNRVPRSWPIPRKGTKSVVVPSHNQRNGIPLLVLLRDMLKVAKDRREVKGIIHEKKIKVNGKIVNDDKYPLTLFDILSLDNKNYKLIFKGRKFSLEEAKDNRKITKIIGKKILPGNKMQINLQDGRNFLVKEKMKTNDSVIIENNKIVKVLELKAGANIIVIAGSHLGEEGKIEKVDGNTITTLLKSKKVNLNINNIMVK